jgi:hypothetical protein
MKTAEKVNSVGTNTVAEAYSGGLEVRKKKEKAQDRSNTQRT